MKAAYSFFIELPMAHYRTNSLLLEKLETALIKKELTLTRKTIINKKKICTLNNIVVKTDYENELIIIEAIIPNDPKLINEIELDPFSTTIEFNGCSIVNMFYIKTISETNNNKTTITSPNKKLYNNVSYLFQ